MTDPTEVTCSGMYYTLRKQGGRGVLGSEYWQTDCTTKLNNPPFCKFDFQHWKDVLVL